MNDITYNLYFDGQNRTYTVHVPPSYDPAVRSPVLIGFHGHGGTGIQFANQSNYPTVADTNNFIFVYPDGSGPPNLLAWNAGPGTINWASRNNIDDVGFIHAMIEDMTEDYTIDHSHIYLSGMSDGASMCHRFALEAAELVTAIGTVSGLIALHTIPVPAFPIPVIHFHGQMDPIVNFSLVHTTIGIWKKFDKCIIKPASVDTSDRNQIITTYSVQPKKVGKPVILHEVLGGGHTWPGGGGPSGGIYGAQVAVVPASQLIWDFVEQFSI